MILSRENCPLFPGVLIIEWIERLADYYDAKFEKDWQ